MPRAPIDPRQPSTELLRHAATILREGGLVAFPTETVYGLGADALNAAAVRKIFVAKGRPSYNPLIVHVPDAAGARELVTEWPSVAEVLAARLWPGPLTLVLPRSPHLPEIVTAGLDTVAVRAPAHPVAQALLREARLPLAAPSANRSTELSPTHATHVERALGERVELILDAGATTVGIESTVLDLSAEVPRLLRPGTISRTDIESLIGPVELPQHAASIGPLRSPGMLNRHYAPRAALLVFDDSNRMAAVAEASRTREAGQRVGAVLFRPLDAPIDFPVRLPMSAREYARLLYATLHELDERGCDLVLIERPPDDSAWAGVRDRIARAAHPPQPE